MGQLTKISNMYVCLSISVLQYFNYFVQVELLGCMVGQSRQNKTIHKLLLSISQCIKASRLLIHNIVNYKDYL